MHIHIYISGGCHKCKPWLRCGITSLPQFRFDQRCSAHDKRVEVFAIIFIGEMVIKLLALGLIWGESPGHLATRVQYSTVLYCTVLYSIVQYSTV